MILVGGVFGTLMNRLVSLSEETLAYFLFLCPWPSEDTKGGLPSANQEGGLLLTEDLSSL